MVSSFKTVQQRIKNLVICTIVVLSGLGVARSQVAFSAPGGFYEHAFSLTLTSSGGTIHYTLDGSAPTAQSPTYTAPLLLSPDLYSPRRLFLQQNAPDDWWNPPAAVDRVIVIRAAAFDGSGNRVGEERANTYFIADLTGHTPQLPMLSIAIDPECLFDADSGIFSPNGWSADDDFNTGNFNQHGSEWERLAHIELHELDGGGFSQRLGLRVHGGKSRRFMQKPLKLYARKEYDKKNIDYPVFVNRPYSAYKRLVLRPFSASWDMAGITDRVAQSIAAPLRFVSLATRPVTLYINGEYWGIYYLQESPDERLVAQIDGVDADYVNVIGSWTGLEENGTNAGFNQLMDFLADADLSDSLQYQHLCSLIDIDNFIDYQLFEAFIANKDWPANNMRCFQHGATPWRWIFYDGDAAFSSHGYDMLTPMTYTGDEDWPSNTASTFCFRRLLESPLFLKRFRDRMVELYSTVFRYENTAPLLEAAVAEVKGEVGRQADRFSTPSSVLKWRNATSGIDRFLRKRPSDFESQMMELISVPAEATVSFLIYPNPAHEACNIRCTSDMMGFVQYSIFDLTSRMVLNDMVLVEGTGTYTINLSPLPAGVYAVRFLPSGEVFKLVVR